MAGTTQRTRAAAAQGAVDMIVGAIEADTRATDLRVTPMGEAAVIEFYMGPEGEPGEPRVPITLSVNTLT